METVQLTLSEAATLLNPPISERQLRDIIHALAIPPAGARHDGGIGRPQHTYNWAEITRLHAALTPWLHARISAKPATTWHNGHHGRNHQGSSPPP